MSKTLISIFIVLIIAISALAQGTSIETIGVRIKALKAEKTLELKYDKAANVTQVFGAGEDFGKDQDRGNNLNSFTFGMKFFFAGSILTAPADTFTTTFWAEEKKPAFFEANAMTVVVDGESLDVGNARYARKPGDPREFLNYAIPRAVLERIVAGKDVQLKVGKAQFKFTSGHLKLFRDLLAVSSSN